MKASSSLQEVLSKAAALPVNAARPDPLTELDAVRACLDRAAPFSDVDTAALDAVLARTDEATRNALLKKRETHTRVAAFVARLERPEPLTPADHAEKRALDVLVTSDSLGAWYPARFSQKEMRDRNARAAADDRANKSARLDRWASLPRFEKLLWITFDRAADRETRRLLGSILQLVDEGEDVLASLGAPEAFGKPLR